MTRIEWTNVTWNPIRGCSPESPGCANCYAKRQARRMSGPGGAYEGLVTSDGEWTGDVRFVANKLDEPLHWREPRRVFVNSMSDLFHPGFTNEQIAAVFGVMAATPQHTYQVLTKRPERALEWHEWIQSEATDAGGGRWDTPAETCRSSALDSIPNNKLPDGSWIAGVRPLLGYDSRWPLPNVHLLVSCEDQRRAEERIPKLLMCPAAVRGVSLEPLLDGPIDLSRYMWPVHSRWDGKYHSPEEAIAAGSEVTRHRQCLVFADSRFLDWVIVGGESGPGARPMHPDWVRSIRDQCRSAGVPFFFKGWGEWIPGGFYGKLVVPDCMGSAVNNPKLHQYLSDPPCKVWRVGKRVAGKLLDDQVHRMFPGERWPS